MKLENNEFMQHELRLPELTLQNEINGLESILRSGKERSMITVLNPRQGIIEHSKLCC